MCIHIYIYVWSKVSPPAASPLTFQNLQICRGFRRELQVRYVSDEVSWEFVVLLSMKCVLLLKLFLCFDAAAYTS